MSVKISELIDKNGKIDLISLMYQEFDAVDINDIGKAESYLTAISNVHPIMSRQAATVAITTAIFL